MRLLLDSHVLLWWDADLSKQSNAQRDAISDPANEVFVSAATAWERTSTYNLFGRILANAEYSASSLTALSKSSRASGCVAAILERTYNFFTNSDR